METIVKFGTIPNHSHIPTDQCCYLMLFVQPMFGLVMTVLSIQVLFTSTTNCCIHDDMLIFFTRVKHCTNSQGYFAIFQL